MADGYDYAKILRQLIVSYLVNVVVFLIVPIGTVVLSRGLSVAEFGVYSLLFIFLNVGLRLFSFGFDLFIQSYLPGRSLLEQQRVGGVIFASVFWITLFALVMFTFFTGARFFSWLNISGYFNEYLLILLAIFLSALAILLHAWFIARQHIEFASFLYCFNSILWIVASGIEFLILGRVILWHVLVFLVLSAFFQLLLSFLKLGSEFKFLFTSFFFFFDSSKRKIFWQGLSFGLPLIPVMMSQWLVSVVDRPLISHYLGNEAVGFYALVYALVGIVSTFGTFVANTFYVYIVKSWNLGDRNQQDVLWNAALKYTLAIVFPGMVGVYILREPLITIIAGAKFVSAVFLVKYFVLLPLFSSLILVLQMLLLVRGKSVQTGLVYVCGAVITYFLNIFLIPFFGLAGAAISLLANYFVMTLAMLFLSRKYTYFNWSFLKIGRILCASLLMGISIAWISPQTLFSKLATLLWAVSVYVILIILFKGVGKDEFVVLQNLFANTFLQRIFNIFI